MGPLLNVFLPMNLLHRKGIFINIVLMLSVGYININYTPEYYLGNVKVPSFYFTLTFPYVNGLAYFNYISKFCGLEREYPQVIHIFLT